MNNPLAVRFHPFDRATLPESFERLVPPASRARWHDIDRSAWGPRLVVATHEGSADEWVAAALVTSRPHTSYQKIVDVVGTSAGVDAVVEAVFEDARRAGAVAVKWEGGWGAGFTQLEPPLVSGPGTSFPATGSVRWLVPEVTVRPVRYYGQTTMYTCGAVTGLSASAALAPSAGDQAVLDAEAEMAFWAEATNHPACEPVGLGVALARRRPDLDVTIALDTDQPVVVEHLSDEEGAWRADLQRQSRRAAAELGIPVVSRRLTVAEIAAALEDGTEVLLLISIQLMRGFPVPHWVRCCGVAGDAVLIDDPAVDPASGESWVDGHLLPIAFAALDEMAAYGDGGYRGAVLLRRRG
ncbi:hypothetical protein Kisp01_25350 [Kineosporia sp. NBRC 101677]|uniref:peptidase C39 family protein n=1 Tax=Kineosporia sp. NBRC 101677 TaxID=3032197 RepID=UPI0024A1D1F5|nr:peptidase C39 family protein [Kineosporia sp. NBRC 101677]GLY15520.1 hypothetical protein Kisp01_25350 [Kineosporia sp. NBRC 101677]